MLAEQLFYSPCVSRAVVCVYMSACVSQFVSPSPSPTVPTQAHSLCPVTPSLLWSLITHPEKSDHTSRFKTSLLMLVANDCTSGIECLVNLSVVVSAPRWWLAWANVEFSGGELFLIFSVRKPGHLFSALGPATSAGVTVIRWGLLSHVYDPPFGIGDGPARFICWGRVRCERPWVL